MCEHSDKSLIRAQLKRKVLLAQIRKWSNCSCNICGSCMMLYLSGQVRAIMLCQDTCTCSICNNQQVATGAQQSCDLLLENVAIACPGLENAGPTMLPCASPPPPPPPKKKTALPQIPCDVIFVAKHHGNNQSLKQSINNLTPHESLG